MNYALKLWCGRDAAPFLERWSPGGVLIREDVIGAYYTARGKGTLARLTEEAALWELRDTPLGLKEFLRIGFTPEWRWERIDWGHTRPRPPEVEAHTELLSHLARGLPQSARDRVLRLVVHLSHRWGPVHAIAGRTDDNPVVVYASGIVAYDRTPHPLPFLQRVAEALFGPPLEQQK